LTGRHALRVGQLFCALIVCIVPSSTLGQQIVAPEPQPASISGTVTDIEDAAIPGATVKVDGPAPSEQRTLKTDESGSFELKDLEPEVSYTIGCSTNRISAMWQVASLGSDFGELPVEYL
jgi:Carboxypeptidase regulatory-like domain